MAAEEIMEDIDGDGVMYPTDECRCGHHMDDHDGPEGICLVAGCGTDA